MDAVGEGGKPWRKTMEMFEKTWRKLRNGEKHGNNP
jgi:hypothetical protein